MWVQQLSHRDKYCTEICGEGKEEGVKAGRQIRINVKHTASVVAKTQQAAETPAKTSNEHKPERPY